VIFQVRDETGCIDCAAYRSTGKVRDAASKLIPGDSVVVSGGVRPRLPGRMTLNVEVLEVTELVDAIRLTNPPCSICGAGCESMGKGQGFRCRKCGARLPRTSAVRKIAPRNITKGIYLPPFRANRHLSRPNLKEPNSLLLSDMN
jgi:tRNA(Ile2)-agmatinylcytidine synthase